MNKSDPYSTAILANTSRNLELCEHACGVVRTGSETSTSDALRLADIAKRKTRRAQCAGLIGCVGPQSQPQVLPNRIRLQSYALNKQLLAALGDTPMTGQHNRINGRFLWLGRNSSSTSRKQTTLAYRQPITESGGRFQVVDHAAGNDVVAVATE